MRRPGLGRGQALSNREGPSADGVRLRARRAACVLERLLQHVPREHGALDPDRVLHDTLQGHEVDITRYAIDRLLEAGAVVYGPKDTDIRGGTVSFWYHDIHPHDLATILNEEGIAVRAGHHCAQLVMRRYGTPATVRASFYVYNTNEEVDLLVASLARAGDIFAS